jgi:peptide-methionine (S)-S-oxide reductase
MTTLAWNGNHCHQQYLSSQKNPNGYCNHGPNGMTCPVGVARVPAERQ